MRLLRLASLSTAALAIGLAVPAAAHPDAGMMPPPPPMHGDMRPDWNGHDDMRPHHEQMRADWLDQCRRQYRSSDNGVGGALIGGAVGGLLGNRIAGRGNRLVGTVVGAGVGAVAGAAIDRADDRRQPRDYCESYLDYYSHAQGGYGSGYGYAQPMMMVPMMMVPAPQQGRQCTETVTITERWVTVPGRQRYIPRRPSVHDKRVHSVRDKRVAN